MESVIIRYEADTTSLEQAQKRLNDLEKQKVKINCEVDVDGKVIQTNIQEAMKKMQDGKINQFKLNLDISALTKQLKQAQSIASKAASDIKSEFEQATTSRTVETLRKNYIGKKSISGNRDTAQEELIKYYTTAQEMASKYKFDVSDATADVDVERVYSYTKALREMQTVIKDIQSVASAKGITLDLDFDGINDKAASELRTLQQNVIDILKNFGETKSATLPPIIEQIKTQFLELPGILSGEVSKATAAIVDDLNNQIATLTNKVKELETALSNTVTQGDYDSVIQDLVRSEEEIKRLTDLVSELQTKLQNSQSNESGMLSQVRNMESELEKYKQVVSEMKAALANKNVQTGAGSATTAELQALLNVVREISEALTAMKSVLVDTGDGQELSPLLQTITNITTAVNELQSSVSKLKFNINLDLGGTDEKSAMKIEGRKQELLSAYQQQFAAMKNYAVEAQKIVASIFKSPSDKSLIADLNKSIALFDESQYDNIDQKIKAYESIIMKMREVAKLQYGEDTYSGLDARYQKQVTQAKSNLTRAIGSVKTESMEEVNNLFGNADYSKVIAQLDTIAQKLNEIANNVSTLGSKDLNFSEITSEIGRVITSINELQSSIKLLKGDTQKGIDTSSFSKELIDTFGVDKNANVKQIRSQVNQLVAELSKAFNGTRIDGSLLTDQFEKVFDNLVQTLAEGSSTVKSQMTEVYKAFYDDYKNIKIFISDEMKNGLGAEYENIFKSGLITRDATKGIDLNSIWGEMSSRYPHIISSEIVNDKEQILAFVDAIKLARTELKGFTFSDLTKDMQSGLTSDAATAVNDMVNKIRPELEQSLKGAVNVSVVDMPDETSQIDSLVDGIARVIEAIQHKNEAFEQERGVVSSVVGSELTELGNLQTTINNITTDIGKMKSAFNTGKKAQSFGDWVTEIGELQTVLSGINPDKMDAFSKMAEGLNNLSTVKVKGKSLTNLIDGIKELSAVDMSQLQNLQGIDFSGLSNLKYVKQADNALSKQSKNFIDTQSKQIESALARYRKAGMDESSLTEIKDLRTLLNTNFTTTALSGVQDVNGEMTSFVTLLSQAIDKADLLAESMKKTAAAQDQTEKNSSSYNSLLTKERQLLQKKIKNGSLGKEDSIAFNETVNKRRQLEKGNNFSTDRRQAIYDDAREAYLDKINNAISNAEARLKDKTENDFTDPKVYQNATNALTQLKAIRDNVIQQGKVMFDDAEIQDVHNYTEAIDKLSSSVKKQVKTKGTVIGNIQSVVGTKEAITELKEMIKFQEEAKGNRVEFGKILNDDTGLTYSVVTKDGSLQKYVATMDQATNAVTALKRSEEPYVSQGQQFVNSIKGKFAELTRYMSVMTVFQKALSFIKKGVTAVREIDTAMTELKKVTDETSASYEKFTQIAGKVATEVGGTTSDIISSTADYARLGYDLEESTELAKNTAIYKNVGDGIDIDTATEDIVSITKAYGIAADKSMEVIDVLNEVGNSYAISSSGIGEGLKRSSSTLAAGNNTFEESVAMLTAMNEVLQDPALAGTTLKMLSLRIRGAKTEIEAEGESVDGMAESTSKLRAQVLALTNVTGKGGFDIMTDNGQTFKSTYDIMLGISQVWKDMSDVDQAALLELIAGDSFSPEIYRNIYLRTHLIALIA